MPLITLGDTNSLIVSIPSKGDTDWSADLKAQFVDKIVAHDHSSSKGVRIPTAGIATDAITGALIADDAIDSEHYTDVSIDTAHIGNLQVTAGKVAADAITEAKVADDAIQVEHKKTISQTLTGGTATTITSISTLIDSVADKAIKLNYRIHNSGTTTIVQTGTITGQAGDYITDEFTGTDIASFSWSGTNLQLTGANNDVLEYSIEFLE